MNQTVPFSWSIARHNMFYSCPRRYAFHYYIANGGWRDGANELSKHAYQLKQLSNVSLLMGTAIHQGANSVFHHIKKDELPTIAQVIAEVDSNMSAVYNEIVKRQTDQ